jgi:hypothetical protein
MHARPHRRRHHRHRQAAQGEDGHPGHRRPRSATTELEIKRLEALAAVCIATALKALRQGRLTLKQARQLARLHRCKTQQAEIAQTALDGYLAGLSACALVVEHDRADGRRSDRFALVGPQRYAGHRAAGSPPTCLASFPTFLLDPDRF